MNPQIIEARIRAYGSRATSISLTSAGGRGELSEDVRQEICRGRYGGPCPPIGTQRYLFKLYALDTVLPDLSDSTKVRLLRAIKGHVLEEAQLIGT